MEEAQSGSVDGMEIGLISIYRVAIGVLAAVESGERQIAEKGARVLANTGALQPYDALFPADGGVGEFVPQNRVAQRPDGQLEVLGRHGRVESREVAQRSCVGNATHSLDAQSRVILAAPGPENVLEQVGCAQPTLRIVGRSRLDHDSDRHDLGIRILADDEAEAVVQNVGMNRARIEHCRLSAGGRDECKRPGHHP